MNGGTHGEILRLNNGHPRRKNFDEKNSKAIHTNYQYKRKSNKK